MPATFQWIEKNGAGGAETVAQNLNFGNVDSPNLADYTASIRVGQNSFEKWIRGKWTSDGTTTKISNCKIWRSAGTVPTGVTVKAGATTTYTQPVGGTTSSPTATSSIGTSFAAGIEIVDSTGVNLGGSGAAVYSQKYLVLQLTTTTAASPGKVPATGSFTFTIQYDES